MTADFKKQYYDSYIDEVLPKMMFLETERHKRLNNLWIKESLFFLLALFLGFISYIGIVHSVKMLASNYIHPVFGTLVFIFSFFIFPSSAIMTIIHMFSFFKAEVADFKKLLKKNCMKNLSKSIPSLKWSSGRPKFELPLTESNIFGAYNDVVYDDIFCASYQGVDFQIQETELILRGSKEDKTMFKGIVICMPSNKKVEAHTIVTTKNDRNIQNRIESIYVLFFTSFFFLVSGIVSLFYTLFNRSIPFGDHVKFFIYSIMFFVTSIVIFKLAIRQIQHEKRLQKISLEDSDFNREFKVQSENQIEARYLVTTAFMERLKNFQTAFGTQNIKCAFFDDKVMFAISTKKDIFEIGNLFVPLSDSRYINKFFDEIISVYNMIEYFKFSQNTGL